MAWTIVPSRAQADLPRPYHRPTERLRRYYTPRLYRPPLFRPPRPPPPFIEPPGRFVPPPLGGSSPLNEDQLAAPVPLSHGFHLTVPIDNKPKAPPQLNRAYEVGRALGACWTPPLDLNWTIITLRLSFKRDGSVNGEPRIPFSDAGSAQQNSDLAHSLLAALKSCTPLPFSPSLGSAIAGEIFAISFTHQDRR